ncbi:MAG TPA: DNA-directed RNA polymerase subunit beta', partial [bacterium]|nr:DNA-directed RNA polymerase subunit beta' [bacterium]
MSQTELEMILYYERYVVIDSNGTPLQEKQLLTEEEYQQALERFGARLRAGIGAEAIQELMKKIDLNKEEESLKNQLRKKRRMDSAGRRSLIKKLRMVQGLIKTQVKPDYMVTNNIPVIPPDLRPLLPLDGGRFVASDLNDLYQRVINRNNRLKKLLKLQAPDIIIRNEKRMLQEAVDALFDNGKHGAPVLGKGKRPLKSLSDGLRGKQGRFRQNLLGKRVDYSGRAVIVVGPELKLNECGVPKEMALELFGPFVLRELRKKEYFHTLGSAKRALTENRPEVWEILEKVSKHHPVLLNRQPTLHRLSIQAFEPRLIEGNVLKIHPLVCPAYNADFDGDTMSIHVPLSLEAQLEAELLMKATTHLLSPASGRPVATPTRDIVLGCYYLTYESSEDLYPEVISGFDEAVLLHYFGYLELHRPIRVRDERGQIITTTAGRIIFNSILPPEVGYQNFLFNHKKLEALIGEVFNRCGYDRTVDFLDAIKELGFHYATVGGLTIGIEDLKIPPIKKRLVEEGRAEAERVKMHYQKGIISEGERYNRIIDIWTSRCNEVSDAVIATLESDTSIKPFRINPVMAMVDSGARGNRTQINQLMGMRGLMIRPTKKVTGGIGEIIETPVISSFREGMSLLEYFLSVHGGRKGLVDAALKTSDAGYLSRRLVDVAHAEIVTEEDCGTLEGILISPLVEGDEELIPLEERIVGRVAVDNIVDIITDETIVRAGEEIDQEKAK